MFAFSGGDPDTLQAGPALMFITIPKVFASMGMGTAVGVLFFVLVLFAAIVAGAAWGTQTYLNTAAYLANDNGKVAVYRGFPARCWGCRSRIWSAPPT